MSQVALTIQVTPNTKDWRNQISSKIQVLGELVISMVDIEQFSYLSLRDEKF